MNAAAGAHATAEDVGIQMIATTKDLGGREQSGI